MYLRELIRFLAITKTRAFVESFGENIHVYLIRNRIILSNGLLYYYLLVVIYLKQFGKEPSQYKVSTI